MAVSAPLIFLDLYDITSNLYVFTHIKPIIQDRERDSLEFFFCYWITIIIGLLLVFTLIKLLVILIYFFIVQSLISFFRFAASIARTKCRVNISFPLRNGLSFMGKICKRLYTYNYYSYDNAFIGSIFILIYNGYLFSTGLFAYRVAEYALFEKQMGFKILHFVTFQFNIIIEVLCISFYNIRSLTKQFYVSVAMVIVLNVFIVLTVLFKNVLINEIGVFEKEEPRRVANIIFFFFLGILQLSTLIGLIRYDVNKEALKALLSEKESFYGSRLPFVTNTENRKINEISQKYKVNGFYYSKDKHNVFKRKDRFQSKIYLVVLFTILFSVNLFEFAYQIFILSADENISLAYWLQFAKNAQTDSNKNQVAQGDLDSSLNETGVQEAKLLSSSLASIKFNEIITSDLLRAVETAEAIYANQSQTATTPSSLIKSSLLRERSLGEDAGKPYEYLKGKKLADWLLAREYKPDKGESVNEVFIRSQTILNDLIHKYVNSSYSLDLNIEEMKEKIVIQSPESFEEDFNKGIYTNPNKSLLPKDSLAKIALVSHTVPIREMINIILLLNHSSLIEWINSLTNTAICILSVFCPNCLGKCTDVTKCNNQLCFSIDVIKDCSHLK